MLQSPQSKLNLCLILLNYFADLHVEMTVLLQGFGDTLTCGQDEQDEQTTVLQTELKLMQLTVIENRGKEQILTFFSQ